MCVGIYSLHVGFSGEREGEGILCNTVDNGFEDVRDAVHNRHECVADGAEDGADLST